MNITDLPPDAMRETLFHLPPDDVINYCTSSRDILEQCNDYPFLRNYVYNNYGLEIDSVKIPGSAWDKFVFVNNLVKRLLAEMRALTNSDFIQERRYSFVSGTYFCNFIFLQFGN